uniref:Uncharacterized protein n=1 Tax=Anguilla anguilla TaxID=7936 RepID=A0A0E9WR11_ANGAN
MYRYFATELPFLSHFPQRSLRSTLYILFKRKVCHTLCYTV